MRAIIATVALACAVILGVTGCAGSSEAPQEARDSSVSGTQDTPDSSQEDPGELPRATATRNAPPPTAAGDEPRGANAAPDALQTQPTRFYNSSDAAKTEFSHWWAYEVQVTEDWNMPFDKVYELGIATCGSRATRNVSPSAIASAWATNFGYTPSGGQAIVVAALKALCPQYDTGFKSYFDKNVDRFVTAMKPKVTWPVTPAVHDFGWFMKEACAYFPANGGSGAYIYEHMVSLREKYGIIAVLSQPGADTRPMFLMIQQATLVGCVGFYDKLPPNIQMA